jgi:hypothetical protein
MVKMYFWSTFLALLTIAVLVLLSMLGTSNKNLKEEMKRRYELEGENYNLKKKIDELKEAVMGFKDGELTKGELIKSVQVLINEEEVEKNKKIAEYNKEIESILKK